MTKNKTILQGLRMLNHAMILQRQMDKSFVFEDAMPNFFIKKTNQFERVQREYDGNVYG